MAPGRTTCWPEGNQDGSGIGKRSFLSTHSLISGHVGRGATRHADRKGGRLVSSGLQAFPGGRRPTISWFRGERRPGRPLASTASTPVIGHGIIPGAFTMFSAMTPDRGPTRVRNIWAALLAVIILGAAFGCHGGKQPHLDIPQTISIM